MRRYRAVVSTIDDTLMRAVVDMIKQLSREYFNHSPVQLLGGDHFEHHVFGHPSSVAA